MEGEQLCGEDVAVRGQLDGFAEAIPIERPRGAGGALGFLMRNLCADFHGATELRQLDDLGRNVSRGETCDCQGGRAPYPSRAARHTSHLLKRVAVATGFEADRPRRSSIVTAAAEFSGAERSHVDDIGTGSHLE